MKYVWGVIFVILFLGCARDTPLVNNKKDLKNYIQPYKEILLFAQGCSYNKDMAKNKALTNFSLKIYSNLQSSFNKNEWDISVLLIRSFLFSSRNSATISVVTCWAIWGDLG